MYKNVTDVYLKYTNLYEKCRHVLRKKEKKEEIDERSERNTSKTKKIENPRKLGNPRGNKKKPRKTKQHPRQTKKTDET